MDEMENQEIDGVEEQEEQDSPVQEVYYDNPADIPEMKEAFAAIQREMDQSEEDEEEEPGDQEEDASPEEIVEEVIEEVEHPQEEVQQEEIPQEEPEYRRKKTPHQYRQEKNELLAQREALRQENERLKESIRKQEYDTKYLQGESVYNNLDHAIRLKKAALEDGDVEEIVKADVQLIKAQNKVVELEEWVEQQKKAIEEKEKPSVSSEEEAARQYVQSVSQEWLKENPEFNPSSIYYDAGRAEKMSGFVNFLDRYLVEKGKSDLYYSPYYFEQIDNYKESLYKPMTENSSPEPAPSPQTRTPRTSPSVAPVRNSASIGNHARREAPKISLSAVEKRMAQDMGVTEQEWLKYKIEQFKEEGKSYA